MATYTAKITSSSEVPGSLMMTVGLEVKKDDTFDHNVTLDVKAVNYQEEIKEYLRTYKDAQEAKAAVQEGEVITLD